MEEPKAETLKYEARALNVKDTKDAAAKATDVEVFGDPDAWRLLGKASSLKQGWMKTTKAMSVPHGVLMQCETQQRNPDGTWVISQALIFIPGATLKQVKDGHYRLA